MKIYRKWISQNNKKRIKKTIIAIIAIILLLLISITIGCSSKSVPVRKITISTDKEIIDNIIIGEDQNYEKIFIDHISSGKINEIKLGDKIVINIGEKAPDYIVIQDWILLDKEGAIYTENIVDKHEYYEESNGSYYFTVDEDLLENIGIESNEISGLYIGIRIEA
ncbi:MAG: hypothetical protein FD141_582 [Fusobacteria bacterium]|nr:MAG: hypothetical protein FD141_582 [Fusobacteriota bacterium]KAF0228752.1 MAG: hypothetical protein FD182_1008 [Fusobacteriota bacterium]